MKEFKPSNYLLDHYQLIKPTPSTTTTSPSSSTTSTTSTSTSSSWSGLGLDPRLVQNIDLQAESIHHQIISTILKIHHTEIYLPNHQSDSSIAYLIGIIQSTIINNHLSNSIHPHHHQHQHQLNPSTLLISLSSVRLNKLDESIKRLTKDIQEICLYELKDSKPLSDQLNEIESQPIWNSNLFLISNLNRVLLLIEKGYLLINSNLKILTIDLRLEDHQTKINHHLINELISFFKFIQPTTQLIFISSNIDSQQRPPPALSSLINQLINQSIHSNLLNSNLIHLHHGHHSEPLIGSDSNTSFDSQFTHLGSSFDPSHHSISSTHFTIPDVGFKF